MSSPAAPPKGRIAQLRQAYTITKRNDRNIGLILLDDFVYNLSKQSPHQII